jgi:hypothetical protein
VPLSSAGRIISSREPEFIENAAEIFFSEVFPDRSSFYSAIADWLEAQTVAAYHGSRLDDADITSISQRGLAVLSAESRRQCLRKKLSNHPLWSEDKLDAVLQQLGPGGWAGRREGQVHATISRVGLMNGFKHYLTHGSEFDQHVVSLLFGAKDTEILRRYGMPILVRLAIPGEQAFAAANPYGVSQENGPNLVREIVQVWTCWLADPTFLVAKLEYDCGLIFFSDLPPAWIWSADRIEDR